MTTADLTTADTRAVPGRDVFPATHATRHEMEARIDRHAIAPGRVVILDLAQRDGSEPVSGTDRAVAVGAILTGVAAAIGLALGLV